MSLRMKPDKRAALFAAGMQGFTEHGYSRASLNQMVETAGLSKSSFYHYFSGKDDFFRQIMFQTLAPLGAIMEGFDPATLTASSFWGDIEAKFRDMADVIRQSPDIIDVGRMIYRNIDAPESRCGDLVASHASLTQKVLERGQEIGTIRTDLPTSLLLNSVMALGMALDRWGLEHMDSLDEDAFAKLNVAAVDLLKRILV